jgi:hypothetical protein
MAENFNQGYANRQIKEGYDRTLTIYHLQLTINHSLFPCYNQPQMTKGERPWPHKTKT